MPRRPPPVRCAVIRNFASAALRKLAFDGVVQSVCAILALTVLIGASAVLESAGDTFAPLSKQRFLDVMFFDDNAFALGSWQRTLGIVLMSLPIALVFVFRHVGTKAYVLQMMLVLVPHWFEFAACMPSCHALTFVFPNCVPAVTTPRLISFATL